MKKFKKWLLSGVVLKLVALLLWLYIKLCYATARWNYSGGEILLEMKNKRAPFVLCFWHGRMMLAFHFARFTTRTNVISSRSKDGDITSWISKRFGIGVVRGSSNRKGKDRGGSSAIRGAVKVLRNSENIAITPDSPPGPRMRVAGKIMDIAALAGAPVIPTATSAKPSIIFNNWDRFMLIFPFSKIEVKIGKPIYIKRRVSQAEYEEKRIELENSMNNITRDIDKKLGLPEINPG